MTDEIWGYKKRRKATEDDGDDGGKKKGKKKKKWLDVFLIMLCSNFS